MSKRDDPSNYRRQRQRQAAHTLKQACGALPTLRVQAVPSATGEKESGAFVPPQKLLKAYPQPVICVPAGQTATEGSSEGKQAAFPQTTRVSAVLFDFQQPDWHFSQTCQSGRWASGGGSTVKTGLIADGQQIPLPPGFNSNQCSWSVSNAQNPHGWKPNYFAGSVAYADVNRIVKCGYYDEYNFHAGTNRTDLSGQCSYVISCQ